jgi:polyisoprenoid-binding protein YceI
MTSLLAAAAAAFAWAGLAQAEVSVTPPSGVKPGSYGVEPNHTRVLFAVSHLGFTTYYGNFTGVSGTLTLDPARPAASRVAISIPTASITTTNAVLDHELKSGDWLGAAAYPTMTFKATAVTPTGKATANIAGELTLHGVTRPVTLQARLNDAGINPIDHAYTVGFDATARIRRSDFGVTKYLPLIGDTVSIIISAAFEHK